MTILNFRSPIISLWLLLLLLVPFRSTLAASFDCNKASTLVETAICTDPELASLDDSLAALYKQALRESSSATQIKARQRAWLKTRNTCKSAGCLRDAYHQRLAELQATPAARPTQSSGIPVRIGDCVTTQIEDKSTRFAGATPGDTGGDLSPHPNRHHLPGAVQLRRRYTSALHPAVDHQQPQPVPAAHRRRDARVPHRPHPSTDPHRPVGRK